MVNEALSQHEAAPGVRIKGRYSAWYATILRVEWPCLWVYYDTDIAAGYTLPEKRLYSGAAQIVNEDNLS